jgi:acetylornithine deacetylase
LFVERRTIPGETIESATTELQNIIDKLSGDDPTFKAKLKVEIWRSPLEIPSDSQILTVVDAALSDRLNQSSPHRGATFWTDAAILADAGIESVILGPVGGGLHSAEEWVDIASLVDLAHILYNATVNYCTQGH